VQPIDIEEVKRVSTEVGWRNLTQPRKPLTSPALTESQTAIQELLRSYLAKSAFPVDELNKLKAAVREEHRQLFEARVGETAKKLADDEIRLHQGLENLRQAERLLVQPCQSQLVTLDQPFLIWQYPRLDRGIFLDWGNAPNNSFVKIKVYVHSGYIDTTRFVFHFLWTNQSEFTAVVKAKTSLIFNGYCLVEAGTGVLYGDNQSQFNVGASHRIWRWGGWGDDPVTGNQTLIFDFFDHNVAGRNVEGGGLFGNVGFFTQELNFQPFFLNANPIAVPPFATIMYQVAADLDYTISQFWSGESEYNIVSLDFARDDLYYRIICPGAVLEVCTPLSSTST